MKKIFIFALSVVSCIIASAQDTKIDFTPSFLSNWSIGCDVIYTKDLKHNNWNFASGTNVGIGLVSVKQLTKNWGFRVIADVPGFFASDSDSYDRRGKGMVGFSYKFSNQVYFFADGGGAVLYEQTPVLKLAADIGLGYVYTINEVNSLFVEVGADVIAVFPKNFENSNVFVKVGYMYNFGLTKTDKERLFVYNEIETIVDEINNENVEIVSWSDSISDCIKKIENVKTENEVLVSEFKIKDSVIFSLDSILNDIKSNSDNFYAMPFSVEFDNDSYVVKKTQFEKIRQVAYIMSSDTTISYLVRGYCDYTGSDEYNQVLSEKRASEVKRILVKEFGVKESQVETEAKGKTIPFGQIESPINRRVSFFRVF